MEKYKFTMKPGRPRNLVLLIAAMIVLGAGTAWAVTTVTATVKFVTDLSVATVTSPSFGYVQAATAGTYTLDTGGIVTASGVGKLEGGAPAAGNFTITGSASQPINISASGYSAAGGTSTPSLATCKYNGVVVAGADCTGVGLTAPGAGKTLLVGLKIVTTGGADGSTDSPTFNLTIVYQ
jgi:hypothetical protein